MKASIFKMINAMMGTNGDWLSKPPSTPKGAQEPLPRFDSVTYGRSVADQKRRAAKKKNCRKNPRGTRNARK